MRSTNITIDYYNTNAEAFIANTIAVDLENNYRRFLQYVPANGKILDFGCGSGRDTKCFLEKGYDVDAIDGSAELCRLAGEYTGIIVKQMPFSEFDEHDKYDGIWACASIPAPSKKRIE